MEFLAFSRSSVEASGTPWLLRKDSSVSNDPSSVIIGSWDVLMAERNTSLAFVRSSEIDGMSITFG